MSSSYYDRLTTDRSRARYIAAKADGSEDEYAYGKALVGAFGYMRANREIYRRIDATAFIGGVYSVKFENAGWYPVEDVYETPEYRIGQSVVALSYNALGVPRSGLRAGTPKGSVSRIDTEVGVPLVDWEGGFSFWMHPTEIAITEETPKPTEKAETESEVSFYSRLITEVQRQRYESAGGSVFGCPCVSCEDAYIRALEGVPIYDASGKILSMGCISRIGYSEVEVENTGYAVERNRWIPIKNVYPLPTYTGQRVRSKTGRVLKSPFVSAGELGRAYTENEIRVRVVWDNQDIPSYYVHPTEIEVIEEAVQEEPAIITRAREVVASGLSFPDTDNDLTLLAAVLRFPRAVAALVGNEAPDLEALLTKVIEGCRHHQWLDNAHTAELLRAYDALKQGKPYRSPDVEGELQRAEEELVKLQARIRVLREAH